MIELNSTGWVIKRPWRFAYLAAVFVAASFWLGWPGLVVALAVVIDTVQRPLED